MNRRTSPRHKNRSLVLIGGLVIVGLVIFWWAGRKEEVPIEKVITSDRLSPGGVAANSKTASSFPEVFESAEIGFRVNVPKGTAIIYSGRGITTYTYGSDVIAVFPEDLEDLLSEGLGSVQTEEVAMGEEEGTRMTGVSQKDGEKVTVLFVERGDSIIRFGGSDAFLRNVQKTYQEVD